MKSAGHASSRKRIHLLDTRRRTEPIDGAHLLAGDALILVVRQQHMQESAPVGDDDRAITGARLARRCPD
jgi:hypothetical protein